jgi:hypothetical protein
MRNKALIFMILIFGMIVSTQNKKTIAMNDTQSKDTLEVPANEKLVIIWTSGDREVAFKMVFMYTFNSKRHVWWDDVTLIIWGPSAKILSEDQELQAEIKKIIDAGIVVKACKGCSDQYGVSEKLEEIGVIVLYIGKELTDYIREERHILTF